MIQEREFERVGGTRPLKVDIRLITATNKDLEQAVTDGTFRQDLYYRLNVVSFEMPPLRERLEDVPLLASYFAAKYGEKCKRRVMGISAEAQARLTAYDWPGNVRELENAIERAVVLGTTDSILPEDLPESLLESQETAVESATPVITKCWPRRRSRLFLMQCKSRKGIIRKPPNYSGYIQTTCID